MPARLPSLSLATRAVPLLGLLSLLSACGPARNEFAPVCPRPAFLADASDLYRYRTAGSGARDLTDLVLHARMVGIGGECKPGDSKNLVDTAVTVGVDFMRGPAMAGRETDVLYFIAVVDGQTLLDKHLYTTHIVFPANVDRYSWVSDTADVVLPVSGTKSAAAYTILVGFQLTPDELATNRQNQ